MTQGPRERGAEAVQAAQRLMAGKDWCDEARLDVLIRRLTAVEQELAGPGEEAGEVSVHLSLLLGIRCHLRYRDGRLDPAERAAALERLRWIDRHASLTPGLPTQARMLFVFLLVPWALPRPDGTRTALQHALLRADDGDVLTEALRRDLTEAREVTGRLIGTPAGEEFRRQCESNRQDIERMLAAGTRKRAETAAPHHTDGADPTAVDRLLDAVRGLVELAGSTGTARFTRTLLWLGTALASGWHDDPSGSFSAQETRLLEQAGGAMPAAGAEGVRRAAALALESLRALPPDTPHRARVARLHAYLLMDGEILTGEPADYTDVERPTPPPDGDRAARLAQWPVATETDPGLLPYLDSHLRDFVAHTGLCERRVVAGRDVLLALRTGDPGYLDDAAGLLREGVEASPAGSWWAVALQADLVLVLERAAQYGGNFHDADVALAGLRELRAGLDRDGSVPPDAPFALTLTLSAADCELDHARRTEDHTELPRLRAELRSRHKALPPQSEWRGRLEERLAEVEALLPPAGQDGPWPETIPAAPPPAEAEIVRLPLTELRAALDEPRQYRDQEYDRRGALGLRLLFEVIRGTGSAGQLDEAIAELTRVRRLIAQGHGQANRVDVLTKLAEAHARRAATPAAPGTLADLEACVAVLREALGELAADVLLQEGAGHGLSAALQGTLLSSRLASIAFRAGRPAEAVQDLERGRALVLRSASAARGIPALLDAAGHPALARQWRARTVDDAPPVPSGLRRQALAALGVRRGDPQGPGAPRLLGGATADGLAAGLAATGTDALVYLMAGVPTPARDFPGRALILTPGAEPVALALPGLFRPGSAALDRYLEAAAERSRVLTAPRPGRQAAAACEARWQSALTELCDWAGEAVMAPLLAAVRQARPDGGAPARPPRIVLVPCGPLGVVPWHAARLPATPGGPGPRYAVHEAVLSYASSGAQFLAASARRRLPLAAGPQVLLADPELSLPWAEMETAALRATCYPAALRYGEFRTADGERDAAGTPEDVLAVLPGGTIPASLVHLSCHAVAAARPTESALRLAVPPGAPAGAERLTVAGILDAFADQEPGPAGPLVVLSACETDLSGGHHDEALTLATALVASGAADVVGSRWAVRDGPTSVMTAVLHHHLTEGRLAPPDALRAAQLWMLDPHREPPPTLTGPLRGEAARPDLHELCHWAAFTHQGNPAPGRPISLA
ncbi:CHAT domain-containing protein [Streptomyces albidoflavus]